MEQLSEGRTPRLGKPQGGHPLEEDGDSLNGMLRHQLVAELMAPEARRLTHWLAATATWAAVSAGIAATAAAVAADAADAGAGRAV